MRNASPAARFPLLQRRVAADEGRPYDTGGASVEADASRLVLTAYQSPSNRVYIETTTVHRACLGPTR